MIEEKIRQVLGQLMFENIGLAFQLEQARVSIAKLQTELAKHGDQKVNGKTTTHEDEEWIETLAGDPGAS